MYRYTGRKKKKNAVETVPDSFLKAGIAKIRPEQRGAPAYGPMRYQKTTSDRVPGCGVTEQPRSSTSVHRLGNVRLL